MFSPQGFVELSSSNICPLESCSPLQMPVVELRVLGAEEEEREREKKERERRLGLL